MTTRKQYRLFVAEVRRLRAAWGGLSNWNVWTQWGNTEYGDSLGEIQYHAVQRRVTIKLSKEAKAEDSEVLYTARHEMIHALLAPLLIEAQARYTTLEQIQASEHEVLHTLHKLLPR